MSKIVALASRELHHERRYNETDVSAFTSTASRSNSIPHSSDHFFGDSIVFRYKHVPGNSRDGSLGSASPYGTKTNVGLSPLRPTNRNCDRGNCSHSGHCPRSSTLPPIQGFSGN